MGLAYNTYLNSSKIYGCKTCKAHLANHEDIISRNFRGQHGKAYLFHNVVNIETGPPNERNMTTGRHVVRDITCRQCKETVGWKYDKAYESSEKYKEGKFILEAELLCVIWISDTWALTAFLGGPDTAFDHDKGKVEITWTPLEHADDSKTLAQHDMM
ncbi:peptidylprolyl isomerase [Fusarium sp. NRRL 25303]|nr:peptidylprolyl isomerase [Fusarium sp. NRRL 25303]